jgi:hypothetical protein
MLKKNYDFIMKQIDYAIKVAWLQDISHDYEESSILKEDSLKNALYYHLRRRLDSLLHMENIRIYTEYNESSLKSNNMRADIAIVELDSKSEEYYLGNRVNKVLAIIELKFQPNGSANASYIAQDVQKIKSYKSVKELDNCQYYLGFIHEHSYCERSCWLDGRQTSKWANGCVTELDACRYDGFKENQMAFSVYSYNRLNSELNTDCLEDMVYVSMI